MTPLFACIPVCLTFVAIAIIGAVVVIFDMSNRIPGDDQPETAKSDETPRGKTGPPPWWVLLLIIVAIVLLMLVSAWYLPE